MFAFLLKDESHSNHGRLYLASEKVFTWMLSMYRHSLARVLEHPAPTLAVLLSTIALNAVLIVKIPKGFFPQQDTGNLAGGLQGPQDSSFPAMDDSLRQLVGVIKADRAVANVVGFTGGTGPSNAGNLFIALKPVDVRKVGAPRVMNR